jgi:hypothetical protein
LVRLLTFIKGVQQLRVIIAGLIQVSLLLHFTLRVRCSICNTARLV